MNYNDISHLNSGYNSKYNCKMLSKQANKLIMNINLHKKGKRFFKVFETLGHDGYDGDGPESNIWDLYIYDINKRSIHWYRREYWFRGEDYEEYRLMTSYTLEEFKEKGFCSSFSRIDFEDFKYLP